MADHHRGWGFKELLRADQGLDHGALRLPADSPSGSTGSPLLAGLGGKLAPDAARRRKGGPYSPNYPNRKTVGANGM